MADLEHADFKRPRSSVTKDESPVQGEIRQLTGLRGIAALDVALTHYGLNQIPVVGVLGFGNSAVDLFFCLSSFTLCLVYGAGVKDRLRLQPYAIARVARIYPLFIVTALVTVWYAVAWKVGPFPDASALTLITQFVRQATLLSEVPLPFLGRMGCWDVPAWSISVEALCYVLAFPLLFALTRWCGRLGVNGVVLLTVALGSVCFIFFVKFFSPYVNGPFFPKPDNLISLWVPLIRGFTMFGAGWGAYLLYLYHREAAAFIGSITDTLAVAFLFVVAAESFGYLPAATVVVFCPFLVLGLMNGASVTARILASPPLHFLGVISYSLYLWHLPMLTIARHFWPWSDSAGLRQTMAYPLLASFVVSTLSYYAMERPARMAIKRLGSGRRVRRSVGTEPGAAARPAHSS